MASYIANHTLTDTRSLQLEGTNGLLSQILLHVNGWSIFFTLLVTAVVYDQASYLIQKGSIVGPAWKVPFVGPFLESVNPNFYVYLAKWDSGELSCVSVFNKFVVIAATRDMARRVFNSPTYCKPIVVPIAEKLLRPSNFVFMDGQEHVAYRKGLNGLFTRSALDIYLPRQQEVYNDYMERFVKISKEANGKPTPFMPHFRELMCAVSCRTFVGYYIAEDAIKKIADDYYQVTAALELVNFPFILPFTKPWYGKRAADMVMAEFSRCSAKAKVRMRTGAPTQCILDAWVKLMLESETYTKKKAAGEDVEKPSMVIKMFSDTEISQTLFTFLFASQDATSSASTWLFQLMADKPELLDRVRAEALAIRNDDINVPLSVDLLEQMTYTRAVVKETLRYRPPVLMVPYMVKRDFAITESYTAKKGTLIVPTTYPALHDPEVYPDPDTFDPQRWIDGDAETQHKNWLVFGTGPHHCLGQHYAIMNLMAMISLSAMHLDWSHEITALSEKVKVFATIFPQDDCLLTFTKRESAIA